jgi:hypothetical protein
VSSGKAELNVGVVASDDIATTIVNHGPMPVQATAQGTRRNGENGTDPAHNHQNDADRADIESVLVLARRDGKIEYGANGKKYEASQESSDHVS